MDWGQENRDYATYVDVDSNASRNIAAFSMWEDGRLRVSEPNAADDEAEGHWTIEADLSCMLTNEFVSGRQILSPETIISTV